MKKIKLVTHLEFALLEQEVPKEDRLSVANIKCVVYHGDIIIIKPPDYEYEPTN